MNKLLTIIIFVLAILLISKSPLINNSSIVNASAKAKTDLQQEYTNIDPLPHSILTESSSANRFIDVYVHSKYTTSSNWNEISKYYFQQATQNGRKSDGKVAALGNKGYQGQIINFRKGNYYLSIESDNIEDKNQTITVSLKWQFLRNIFNIES
jgi:hypothetical protein